ncbi:hypothetical protein V8E51_014507 [Hyaloscypha variabilis]
MKASTTISAVALTAMLQECTAYTTTTAPFEYVGFIWELTICDDSDVLNVMATDTSRNAGNFTQIGGVCQDMSNTGGAYIDWANLCTVDSGGAENCPCTLVGGGIVKVGCLSDGNGSAPN